jgi:hypothetical protein
MAKAKTQAQQVHGVIHWNAQNPAKFKGFRPVWCAEHHFTGPWPCECDPGPQVYLCGGAFGAALNASEADEIASGGTRGSAKTAMLLYFMAFKGNPRRASDQIAKGKTPAGADISYIYHKNFRGLILRDQATDLGDLIDRGEEMYAPTGGVVTRGNPPECKWPSGAKIIFGHFGEDGWRKYVGQEYIRMGIDQAEQLPSREIYNRITGSCRSKWSELKTQVMLTFNPGGGDVLAGAPGQAWLMDYFLIDDYVNGRFPKGAVLKNEAGKTTTFIPSSYRDNPYLLHYVEFDENNDVAVYKPGEGKYVAWLDDIEPESLRAAWRDANWYALSGTYFRDFRPNGPINDKEPPNARHVYDPSTVRLEPWYKRWMSIDWGFIHPTDIQFHCKTPWGQVYTYKEISLNRVEPVELGVLIACQAREDLKGLETNHMNVFLSPDAYAKRDSDNTVAHQIAAGIARELGPGSAFVADLTENERELRDSEQALLSMQRRRREQSKTQLTLLRASTDRVAGWMHMQSLLRFRPLHEESKPDPEFADRLLREKGIVVYQQYMNQPEFGKAPEILPKWQIHPDCRALIKCLPTLMHKPGTNDIQKVDATETRAGDDAADSARYGLFSEERQGEMLAPLETRVAQRVAELQAQFTGMSAHSIHMAANHARYEEMYGKRKKAMPFVGHNPLAVKRAMWEQSRPLVQ